RRHTRFSRDWSSDVCSSDLKALAAAAEPGPTGPTGLVGWLDRVGRATGDAALASVRALSFFGLTLVRIAGLIVRPWRMRWTPLRSEERRVGEGGRPRGGTAP